LQLELLILLLDRTWIGVLGSNVGLGKILTGSIATLGATVGIDKWYTSSVKDLPNL